MRKVMFVKYAQAFVVMPGGFGTLDEMFEVLTLIQTKRINRVPVVLIGTTYWAGLIAWLKSTMLEAGNINSEDLKLFSIVDSAEDAVRIIADFYADEKKLKTNYHLE